MKLISIIAGIVMSLNMAGSVLSASPQLSVVVPSNDLAPAVRLSVPQPRIDPLSPVTSPNVGDHCADGLDSTSLTRFFSNPIGPLGGADYQRTIRLDDGRVLWAFQDGFISGRLVHNVGMVQSGRCFTILNSGTNDWLFDSQTVDERDWHWVLSGDMNAQGNELHLFVANMRENSDRYLGNVSIPALNRVVFDASTLRVKRVMPETIHGEDLYGWSVTADDTHTFYYSQCFKQFGYQETFGHADCAKDAKVARSPVGQFDAPREYWDGTAWSPNPAAAVSVVDGLFIVPTRFGPLPSNNNPVSVRFDGHRFRLISNPGDWWGNKVFTAASDSPVGPWTIDSEIAFDPACRTQVEGGCTTYHAAWVPWRNPDGRIIWSIGHNVWNGSLTSTHLDNYRPTFHSSVD